MSSILRPQNARLLRLLVVNSSVRTNTAALSYNSMLLKQTFAAIQSMEHQAMRYTSTTSSSKGQAISITDLTSDQAMLPNSTSHDSKPKLDLTFEDSQTAFKSKSTLQLLRGYLVFQLCSINFLIDHQKKLLEYSRRILGKRLFNTLMKSTFYGHFVAGEDQNGIRSNVESMMKYGVKSILDYSAEEDLEKSSVLKGESRSEVGKPFVTGGTRQCYEESEIQFEKNTHIFMGCVEAVSDVTNSTGLAAVKLTSLIRPQLLLKLNTFVDDLKKSELSAGSSSKVLTWKPLIGASQPELAKIFNSDPKVAFTASELGEMHNMFSRMDEIVENAIKKNVRIFVDAEQTYFQDAIHRFTVELMRHFNRNKCVILNTYQNYLKSAHDTLKSDIDLANKEDFFFGAKLVRGAYMDQERERAKEMSYADPINDNYEATTKMYETNLLYCLNEIKKKPLGRISIMVASHNEETVKFAVEKMGEYSIKPGDRIICFGQLLGMCDYISFYLGGIGYSVYKYVPYGPVEEVLPYLSRRATENRGIFEKVKKEKRLLFSELRRRLTGSGTSANSVL